MNGYLVFGRVLDTCNDIRRVSWTNYAQRQDLIDTGIASVDVQIRLTAVDLAIDEPPQVGLNSCSLLIHPTYSVDNAWLQSLILVLLR